MADNSSTIHSAITLGVSSQDVTTDITNPAVPRCVQIKGNAATVAGNVVITGTDDEGAATTDTIVAAGTAFVFGTQLFATVTNINVPAKVGGSDAISIGHQDRLFTVAEARAFDAAQLASVTDYPEAAVLLAEARIREWLEDLCQVAFLPTYATEVHNGDGSPYLWTDRYSPLAITAVSVSGTALTAAQLDQDDYSLGLAVYHSGRVVRRSGLFTTGMGNVVVMYYHGYNKPPEAIKRAALLLITSQMPVASTPYATDSYDADGVSVSLYRGDGWNGVWSNIPEVTAAIRRYSEYTAGMV